MRNRPIAPVTPARHVPSVRAVALALFALTALLFARALSNGFVNYDDPDYVTSNQHVLGGLSRAGVRWALTARVASNWHPLTWISHMADVALFGRHAAGHHATSVLLHALAAALAFVALRRLTGALWPSAVCAALFAWHPLRVESVAWVAERKDVLSGVFFFATLWAYARHTEARARRETGIAWYAGALLLFALGLTAKPMLVTLPCVLLLLDFWPLRRLGSPVAVMVAVLEKLPFFALSAASSVVTYHVQKTSGAVTAALSLGDRVDNAVVSVPRYLGKIFWPVNLAVLYPHPGHWPTGAVVGSAALLVLLTGIAVFQIRRRPWVAVGWFWFLGTLVPVIGLVQVGLQSMADRYTYLPVIGLEMAVVWSAREWIGRRGRAVGVGLGALAVLTFVQLGAWKNSAMLFTHTIAVAGRGNYLAYDNRGIALQDAGETDAAVADYERALAIRPDYANANNNLGRVLAARGELPAAIAHYRLALRSEPDLLEVHNNLANALSDAGQIDAAIKEYRFVLDRDPGHVNARNGYATALAMKGDLAGAEREFNAVLGRDPGNLDALSNLGNVYALEHRYAEAAATYQRALQRNPDDARTLFNLGNVSSALNQPEQAAAYYARAVALAPVNPDAHAQLGAVLARLGRRAEAIQQLQIALQQRPNFPQARAWLETLQAGR